MKTVGLIGGMSWESSSEYYRLINQMVKERLGGLHSAECILYSVDFEAIEKLQHQGEWEELTKMMIKYARRLEDAGAELIVICTNTMHKMAEEVQNSVSIPLVHIADATAEAILAKGLTRVGLLGTKFTMEEEFYRNRLNERYDIEVMIPPGSDRTVVDDVIYRELCRGIIKKSSKEKFRKIINTLARDGSQGVILGCTEIPLLVGQDDVDVPLFEDKGRRLINTMS
jgi:aspartate racemase